MSLTNGLFTDLLVMLENQVATRRPGLRIRSNYATISDNPGLETTDLDLRPIEALAALGGGGGGGGGSFAEVETVVSELGTLVDYNANNWGLATSVVFENPIPSNQSVIISSLEAPAPGTPHVKRFAVTSSSGTSFTVRFYHESTGAAANRIWCPGEQNDVRVSDGDAGFLVYMTSLQRWHLVFSPRAEGAIAAFAITTSNQDIVLTSQDFRADVWEFTRATGWLTALTSPITSSRRGVPRARHAILRNSCFVQNMTTDTIGVGQSKISIAGHAVGELWRPAAGGGDHHVLFIYNGASNTWDMKVLEDATHRTVPEGFITSGSIAFTGDRRDVWNGANAVNLTLDVGASTLTCERWLFLPATVTSLTLSTNLDPTGEQVFNFTGVGNSHWVIMSYVHLSNMRSVTTTVRRVTKL